MRTCQRCVLDDTLFSVRIGADGLCNLCAAHRPAARHEAREESLDAYRNPGGYDVLLAYSGGKDSTYTLHLLRNKYKLRVLAMTFDNGFLSPGAFLNIRRATERLDADSLIVAPSFAKLRRIFQLARSDESLPRKALERASTICTYCIGIVKALAYREAIERKIPLIAFGWTPGQILPHKQIVRLEYRMILANFKAIRDKLEGLGAEYGSFFPTEAQLYAERDRLPSLFYPFPEGSYDEDAILKTIEGFGWERPGDTDTNSSNCLLNAYAIHLHRERYGFHPYALELSELVREGTLSREEALARIEAAIDPEAIRRIEARLE